MPRYKKHRHIYDRALKSFENMTTFEKTVTIIGSIEPITSIPQVLLVYELQSAEELSLFTWGFGILSTTFGLYMQFLGVVGHSLHPVCYG